MVLPACNGLEEALKKIEVHSSEVIEQNHDLPQPKSNRGYKVTTILECFITSSWCRSRFF